MQCGKREPIEFTPGDTLWFEKVLPQYLPPVWFCDYEIRGGAAAISFQSVPNQTNTAHVIKVLPAVTVLWLPGQMLMQGFIINSETAERHQIYLAELTLDKNLQGAAANVPVKTFAQTMLEKYEAMLSGTADSNLLESRIGETVFRYLTPEQLQQGHGYWYQKRQNEIAVERARNGQNTGQKIRPRMNITQPGPLAGQALYPAGWGAS